MRLSLILETNLALIANKLSISPDKLQELLSNADPTNGKYKDYIIKLLLNKNIRLPEDNHRLRETLSLFHAHKNRLPVKDINRYKSLHELETAIEQYQGASKRQGGLEVNPISLPGVQVYHKQGKYTTLKITNPDSLAELGEGTKWCTRKSYPDCQAEYYIDKYNHIFIILEGNKPIIQYTPDYEQIMDRDDEQIEDKELLQKLIPKPQLIYKDENIALITNYIVAINNKRQPEIEQWLIDGIKKKAYNIDELSKLIYSYAYSTSQRWPEGEHFIKNNAEVAYWYARDVIKDRWLEAEPWIKTNPIVAYHYAVFFMENEAGVTQRWLEAEPYIARDAHAAYLYARDIIKGRWLEAEPVMKESQWWSNYSTYIYNKYYKK